MADEVPQNDALLREFADAIQVGLVLFGLTADGQAVVTYANDAAHQIFAYPPSVMVGASVSALLPGLSAADLDVASRATTPVWANWDGRRADGVTVPVGASVSRRANGSQIAYVMLVRDRTGSVASDRELQQQVASANAERQAAARALGEAQERLFVQRKLATQVELVRLLWRGTVGLIVMLALLVCVGWATGKYEKDSLAMFERILLVLAGMLGTALAGIFDKRGDAPESK